MLKAVFIILSCLFFCELRAQNDSLQVSSLLSQKRKVQECLLPASLITVGVISNATFINRYVQRQAYHYSGGEKLRFDDYIQYVPLASVFAFSNLGVKPKHTIKERLIVGATAYAIMGAVVNGIKYTAKIRRPDNSAYNSFPSGHTANVFTGMEMLWQEYKDDNIWIGIGGYTIATTVGAMRIYNNRHWIGDVLVGAGVGILSVRVAYWLLPHTSKWFAGKRQEEKNLATAALYPVYSSGTMGVGLIINY